MAAYCLGGILALRSAHNSLSVPSASPGLSVGGVPLGGETGLDAAYREDFMVRNIFLFFQVSTHKHFRL